MLLHASSLHSWIPSLRVVPPPSHNGLFWLLIPLIGVVEMRLLYKFQEPSFNNYINGHVQFEDNYSLKMVFLSFRALKLQIYWPNYSRGHKSIFECLIHKPPISHFTTMLNAFHVNPKQYTSQRKLGPIQLQRKQSIYFGNYSRQIAFEGYTMGVLYTLSIYLLLGYGQVIMFEWWSSLMIAHGR